MSAAPKSWEFRREREATWVELDRLVTAVEKRGVRSLPAGDLARLPLLYRATLSSLSVARSISLDAHVVDYLESLAARAYFVVYGTRRHLWDALRDFAVVGFPSAVRRARRPIGIAAIFLALGAVAGYCLVAADPDRYYSLVDSGLASGRNPAASTEELRAALYGGGPGEALVTLASSLFSNNARIGILAFGLGFLFGAPVFVLMLMNGLMLGAFAALYGARGLGVELWAWLLPHGITELSAVALCGGAGLVLAQALIFPGRLGRIDSLALRGREAGTIALGGVAMFFIAGLIEGIFRQEVTSVPVRYAVALATLCFWGLYFWRSGRASSDLPDSGGGP
jgi:uncharacterized membrane protein SpoIIM required for sporulation